MKRIVHLSKPWAPVPPPGYGGIERFVYSLIDAQRLKHKVYLYAPGNSIPPPSVILRALFPNGFESVDGVMSKDVETVQALHCALTAQHDSADIIHAHSVNAYLAIAPFIRQKSVFTFHTLPDQITETFMRLAEPYVTFTFLSHQHRKQYPEVKNASVIYYGVDMQTFPYAEEKQDYLAFVGAIMDAKGIVEAIEISRKARMRLRIGGHVKHRDKLFYEEVVRPLIERSSHVTFLGELDDAGRNDLLKHAKAMLFPIKWEEPFGSVMTECMAVGTPVIAFNRGSVPELILDGRTGYIVENIAQAVAAIQQVGKLKPQDCRNHVATNFSIGKAARSFEKLYAAL